MSASEWLDILTDETGICNTNKALGRHVNYFCYCLELPAIVKSAATNLRSGNAASLHNITETKMSRPITPTASFFSKSYSDDALVVENVDMVEEDSKMVCTYDFKPKSLILYYLFTSALDSKVYEYR